MYNDFGAWQGNMSGFVVKLAMKLCLGRQERINQRWLKKIQGEYCLWKESTVGKYVSEENVKRSDDGQSVVGGTQIGNVKRSDEGPSVVGSAQRGMSYAEAVSKR